MPKRPARPRPFYPRPPTPPPAFRPAPAAAHAPRPTRALIWIDGDPIRSKARKEYEKARRDLDKARVQIEKFQSQDMPAFGRWMNATFGQQLTETREITRQLAEQGALLAEIDDYMFVFGVGPGEAYAAVMHHRAHPEEAPPQPPPRGGPGGPRDPGGPGSFMDDDDEDESEADPDFDPRSDEAIYEKFAKAFEQAFGQAPPPEFRPPGPPPKRTKTASVKDLYRALVRKLHPDTQATMTPQKLEWWHEVQEAYADNDAERLEVILNLIEMSEGEPTAQTSVSLLRRIIARLKVSLREIKREVTARKQDPAWNFTTRGDRDVLAARVQRELAVQLEHLHRAYAADETILRRFAADARRHTERLEARAKKPAPKRPPPPGQKRPPGQNEFYF